MGAVYWGLIFFRYREPFASCHFDTEPFVFSHYERSEESGATQGKLREGEESHSAQDRLREAILNL